MDILNICHRPSRLRGTFSRISHHIIAAIATRMANSISSRRMIFKSVQLGTKEVGSSSVELVQCMLFSGGGRFSADLETGIKANNWRKPPSNEGTSSEAILPAYASMGPEMALVHLQATHDGLTQDEAVSRLLVQGPNMLSIKKPPTWWQLLLSVIPNPFNILLALLAIISVSTPPPSWSTFILLLIMIVISCAVRFWQEYRSNIAAIKLQEGTRRPSFQETSYWWTLVTLCQQTAWFLMPLIFKLASQGSMLITVSGNDLMLMLTPD